jgi:polar amino acid transport system substrate-binding protein
MTALASSLAFRLAFAYLAASLALAAPAGARPLDEVVESKVLRVVVYEDNEPFSWLRDGVPTGIDVEIAKALALKLGVNAEIITRMQGEQLDQDLRFNIVRGTLGGGIAGDVMLHIPVDRELNLRNKEAVIGNAYFRQQVALAVHPDHQGEIASFDAFKTEKIGVQLGTVADYFLMRYDNGALVPNVAHHLKVTQGVQRFVDKETLALLGLRSNLEALLKSKNQPANWENPPMPGLIRASWVLGTAVSERSRDLGHAVGAALAGMREDGTLKSICEKYGVTYQPPSDP